jgi:hypothetical protein
VLNCVGAGAAQLIALVGEAEAKCAALAEENAKLRRDVALKTNAGGLAAAYNDAAQQGKVAALIATDAKRHERQLLEAARRRDTALRMSTSQMYVAVDFGTFRALAEPYR